MTAWLLIIQLFIAQPSDLTADSDIICNEDDPRRCVQIMKPGDRAQFQGQLLTDHLAASLGVKANQCQEFIDLAVNRERQLSEINLTSTQEISQSALQGCSEKIKLLDTELKEQQPTWYTEPWFVAAVSVVATVGAMIAVKHAVNW